MDNLITGNTRNIEHLLGEPPVPVRQARRHRVHLRRRAGRRDPALRLAGLADRLPGAADPDAEGRRARHAQGAGPREGQEARDSCSRRPPRSTAIRWSIRSPRRYWGNVNPIGPRGVYDEAKRFAEAHDDGLSPLPRRRHADRAHLQHVRPAHAPATTAASCRRSSARRCAAKPLTVFGDGSQTRSRSATSTT